MPAGRLETPQPRSHSLDTGPLPDYIVDPNREDDGPAPPSRAIVRAESTSETWPSAAFPDVSDAVDDPEPEPRIENLGLPPLSEFPGVSRDEPTQRATPPRADRAGESPRAKEPPKRRGRKAKAAEPGDEVEGTGWMDGLSSRLSADSLTGSEQEPDADDEPTADGTDEQPAD